MVRTRNYLERGVIGQVADHLCVQFKLKYVGDGSVTSVIVTTATDITMVSVGADAVTYTDAFTWVGGATNYTTVGTMCAAINATGRWEAKAMDALSSTLLGADLSIAGTLSADANGEYSVMSDTTNQLVLAYRLTYDRTFKTNAKLRKGHRVHIQELITTITAGGPDANAFKIYECSQGDNSMSYSSKETVVYQKTPSNSAASTTTWASGEGKLSSNEGNDLVVVITDGASLTGSLTVVGEIE